MLPLPKLYDFRILKGNTKKIPIISESLQKYLPGCQQQSDFERPISHLTKWDTMCLTGPLKNC